MTEKHFKNFYCSRCLDYEWVVSWKTYDGYQKRKYKELGIEIEADEPEPTKKEVKCPKCLSNEFVAERKTIDARQKGVWLISVDTDYCKWEYPIPVGDNYSIKDIINILLKGLNLDQSFSDAGVLMSINEKKTKLDYELENHFLTIQTRLGTLNRN